MKMIWSDSLLNDPEAFISLRKPREFKVQAGSLFTEVIHASAATPAQLMLVHDEDYVRGVLSGVILNGFGTNDPLVLQHVLAANGVMIKAVEVALDNPGWPICAPVSGFHHAFVDSNHGYCTFNGLLVSIAAAQKRVDAPRRVLIVDGDGHFGDGTDAMLHHLTGVFSSIEHVHLHRHAWQAQLKGLFAQRWDLVLYQAGADAAVDDPYGVGYLKDEDWDERDVTVFTECARYRCPIVWNLAGGYNGQHTLDLHHRTAESAARLDRGLRMQAAILRRPNNTPAAVLQPKE